jgi:uncharacterized protein YkwD
VKVKEIMNKNPVIVLPDTPIHELEKIFQRNKFWSIYIGDKNSFIGVVTRKDIQNRAGSYPLTTPVRSIMSNGVISIDENADIEDAQRLLSSKKINGIAVTRNGKHVGIVTRYDIKTKSNVRGTRFIEGFSVLAIAILLLSIGTGLLFVFFSFAQSAGPQVQHEVNSYMTQGQDILKSIQIPEINTDSEVFPAPTIDNSKLEQRIHELINQQRKINGLSTLSFDSKLATIARGHSSDMAKNSYFSHINLQGQDAIARGNQQGYPCRKDYGSYYTYGISENIFNTHHDTTYNGITVNDFESIEVMAQKTVNGWMNSPGHRKNILTTTFDREGIGVGISSDCTVYITENFC